MKILGIFINPELNWNEQFKIMKNKLKDSIKKVIAIKMTLFQAHIYFNMHKIKSVFFGTRIFKLTKKSRGLVKTDL